MKALILAAGFGSRLMPLTKTQPKCMVAYQNKPILEYILHALRGGGVEDIGAVGGYLFEVFEPYARAQGIAPIYQNARFDTTNMVSTLFCAREFLDSCLREQRDLIVSYGDIIYHPSLIQKLSASKHPLSIVVDKNWLALWKQRFSDPLSDAETLKIKNGLIVELGKKPKSYEEIEAQYIGLFKISWSFLEEVMICYDGLSREGDYDGKSFDQMYMTSFLQILIDRYANARALEIFGGWCEIDCLSDLDCEVL